MKKPKSVTVAEFYRRGAQALGLEQIAAPNGSRRTIGEPTISRPGLVLAGFRKFFPWRRVQTMGTAETQYVKSLPPAERRRRYDGLFGMRIPCLVLCRGIRPDRDLLAAAAHAHTPVFRSSRVTMNFINDATLLLEDMFAPEKTELGSMVDILGIGVIIKGDPGIGKSECVLALIERGYSLVSDDVVRVRLSEERKIIGSSPEVTREFMEVRGIGVINVPSLFGVRSYRTLKQVDLIVSLREWQDVPEVERVGLESQSYDVLGVSLPHMVIPVRPGRDIARLVEVAAFYIKHRLVGGNPAQDLNQRILNRMQTRRSR
ncbi:MAG: HPr(Ser) kinase/phosphatase [Verrucomicrobiales bacterium]|nr:HPr(Ser) kinase/phosphatase [Verrucomicrobiales bacterium]